MSKLQTLESIEVEELEEGEALELPSRDETVTLRKDAKFEDRFIPLDELGSGAYGLVKKCRNKKSGVVCAAKFVEKTAKSMKEIAQEVEVMNYLHHKRIVYLMDAFESTKHLIVVMELVTGGELFEKVVEEDDLTERQVVRYMRQVLFGLQHMHKKNIVHLDLKPENILCVGGGRSGYEELKLIDFGLSRKLDPNENTLVFGGTAEFVSPEVSVVEPVSLASDMWSIGVITYVLISGISPFVGEDDDETMRNVSGCEWTFEDAEESFEQISKEAKLFIEELLVREPKERNSVEQCLNHKWFAHSSHERKLKTAKLKRFIIRRRWQKAANAVKAVNRLDHLGQVYARNHGKTTRADSKFAIPTDSLSKLVSEASASVADAAGATVHSDTAGRETQTVETSTGKVPENVSEGTVASPERESCTPAESKGESIDKEVVAAPSPEVNISNTSTGAVAEETVAEETAASGTVAGKLIASEDSASETVLMETAASQTAAAVNGQRVEINNNINTKSAEDLASNESNGKQASDKNAITEGTGKSQSESDVQTCQENIKASDDTSSKNKIEQSNSFAEVQDGNGTNADASKDAVNKTDVCQTDTPKTDIIKGEITERNETVMNQDNKATESITSDDVADDFVTKPSENELISNDRTEDSKAVEENQNEITVGPHSDESASNTIVLGTSGLVIGSTESFVIMQDEPSNGDN